MKRSLLLRFGLTLAAIFALAVISMLSSVFITETAEGYAAAINQAGTLRMQSYRIASSLVQDRAVDDATPWVHTELLVNEFNERLFSPRIQDVLSKGPSRHVLETYAQVEARWLEKIHPLLSGILALSLHATSVPDRARTLARNTQDYLNAVDGFVDDIHAFVKALEIDAEKKNRLLRIIQIVSLMCIFIVAILSIYLAKITVLKPLRELQVCANSARQGDFSLRSNYLKEDELGQLGQAFNVMAEDLSKMYADLEQRVREKTLHLQRSNSSLELLYNTTRTLSDSSLSDAVLQKVIGDVRQLMGLEQGTICLGQAGARDAFRLVTSNPDYRRSPKLALEHCDACLRIGRSRLCRLEGPDAAVIRAFTTPIRDQHRQYGILMVELGAAEMEEWRQRLLETVASHVALSINIARQVSQDRMVSLLEERSVIARELHDSLAQSLSYLKIQVSRLEKAVKEAADRRQVLEISQVLRSALNGAYRQLRDLLTTFRLRISDEGFDRTLEETVEEFANRGEISIELNNRTSGCRFSPNAEIHLIQIIREALSNVIRHANATHAEVSLECDRQGRVTLLVEDDGIGLGEPHDMMQHYGLPIMQERAEWLGGTMQIDDREGRGTRIRLTFSNTEVEHTHQHRNLMKQFNDV